MWTAGALTIYGISSYVEKTFFFADGNEQTETNNPPIFVFFSKKQKMHKKLKNSKSTRVFDQLQIHTAEGCHRGNPQLHRGRKHQTSNLECCH